MDENGDFDPRAGGVKGRNGPRWVTRLIRKDPFDRDDDFNVDDEFDPRAAGVKGRRGPKWLTRLIRKDPHDTDD